MAAGLASRTLVRDYVSHDKKHCRPFFGNTPLAKIDTPMVRRFRDTLLASGIKPATALHILSFLSVVLKQAHEDGLIRQLPYIPRKGQKPAPRPAFTRASYRALLQALRGIEKGKPVIAYRGHEVDWELRAIVTFMVNSFFRPGDLFSIKHKHVTVVPRDEDGPAFLRIDAPSSKDHHAPIITMPVAVPIYQRVRSHRMASGACCPDDYVFMPGHQNRAYAQEIVRRQFRLVLKHADLLQSEKGVDHTLYSLRHSAITFRLLHARDIDLLTLARAARTSVEMIDRYYASSLTAEMNRDKLHSFRRPTRFLTESGPSKAA